MRRLRPLIAAALGTAAAASLVLVPTAASAQNVTNGGSTVSAAQASQPDDFLASKGYWMIGADGGVSTFGNAAFAGSAAGGALNGQVVATAATHAGTGYWMTGTDGGVFAYGNARFYGSTGNIRLNQPVVGMAATPTDDGYWFVARDGGIFAYAGARFFGSTGSTKLNQPIVGMAATPTGNGYWLVASDGGIFSFGDARFKGSTGSLKLNKPIVGMAATPSGQGYWLVASDGGIFSFGDAKFYGSTGGVNLAQPIVAMTPSASGGGYYLVAADGGLFTYGDAPFLGGTAGHSSARTVAIATTPRPRSSEVSIFYYPWYSSVGHDGSWRHWDQGGATPPDYLGADYWPTRGAYSSKSTVVLEQQMTEIKSMGINTIIVSWWGHGSWEDESLQVLMPIARAHGLGVALHIEPYTARDAASVYNDFQFFYNLGIRDFYVYEANRLDQNGLRAANAAIPSDARTFAESSNFVQAKNGTFAASAASAGFTGVYSYAGFGFSSDDFGTFCDAAHANHLLCSPSVSPGFSGQRATPIKTVSSRAFGATYDTSWAGAIAAGGDIVSITSYNEWHEGTQIEPASPHCLPNGTCLLDYSGAWGDPGPATTAYVDHTRAQVQALRARFGGTFP